MIRALRALGACAPLALLAACSGHAVDLDRNQPAATPVVTGTNELGDIERLDMAREVGGFYVQGPRVFWQSNAMYSCEFEHCRDTLVAYDVPATATLTGVSADDVFFSFDGIASAYTQANIVARCPWSGCDGGPKKFLQDDRNAGWGPALDANYFYWQSTYDVLRCPLSGCAAVPELVAKDQSGLGSVLGLSAEAVFYVPFDPGPLAQWALRSAPKDGSAPPTTIAQSATSSSYLVAVGRKAVYWADHEGVIRSCPLAGCDGKPPTTVVDSATNKLALRVDEERVYWNETADEGQVMGTVRFCPLTGCAPGQEPVTLIPSSLTRQFELDAKYIYWTEYVSSSGVQPGSGITSGATTYAADSSIYRMPKPKSAP